MCLKLIKFLLYMKKIIIKNLKFINIYLFLVIHFKYLIIMWCTIR